MDPNGVLRRDFELQLGRRQLRRLDASFLWDEVAARMLNRMQWVRQVPQSVLVLGDSRLGDAQRLAQSYPNAIVLDFSVARQSRLEARLGVAEVGLLRGAWRELSAQAGVLSRLRELLRKPKSSGVLRLAGSPMPLGLRDSVVDLLWLNGMLHWWSDWPGQLRELRRAARPGALLSFSLLGVDSFSQLRPLAPGLMRFPDMHDLGDALVRAGWAEPVVDMERIDLSWREVDTMLRDLRAIGGNCLDGRFGGMRGRKWYASVLQSLETLRNADGLLRVQLELILGHAWRAGDPDKSHAWKPVRVARKSPG